jgi:hypothetical protein
VGGSARPRRADAALLPRARRSGHASRRGRSDASERCGSTRHRAALAIPNALPLLPGDEGVAGRRPPLPRPSLRVMRGTNGGRAPNAPAPLVLRHAQHTGAPTCRGGARTRHHPVPQWRPVRPFTDRATPRDAAFPRRRACACL